MARQDPSAQNHLRAENEQPPDHVSWFVMALALAILLAGAAITVYRLRLPSDGWSFTRDATGSGRRLVFLENLAGAPSPLAPGDVLLAIQGQPYGDILSRALTLAPQRPVNWTTGSTVYYTVQRGAEEELLAVPLVARSAGEIASRVIHSWLADPSLLPALLIAFFVFWRRPRNAAARLFFLLCVCFFVSNGMSQAITGSNVPGTAELFYPAAYWPAQFFSSQIWVFVIAPIYVQLFLTFPVAKFPILRFRRATLAALYGFMPLMALVTIGLARGQSITAWDWWDNFSMLDLVLSLGIAIVSAGHTLMTVRDRTLRAQIQWVAWGVVITSAGALSGAALASLGWLGRNAWVDLIAFRLPFLGIPVALAIAILRYRLFDIEIILRRTLIYTVLSALLAGVYFVSVVLLQELFRDFGARQNEIVTVISTLVLAAMFIPLRSRVQEGIDRRFYRQKYDTVRAIAEFGDALRNEVDLDRLTDRLAGVVEETMEPKSVSLWLKGGGPGSTAGASGRQHRLLGRN